MFFEYLLVFVFGLCIGSFLNCVIYRLEAKKGLGGRSFCPKCKKELAWQDLIPVFSFLFLKGKCRNCKQKISIQYPFVELATGIVFLLVFYKLAVIPDPRCCLRAGLIGNPEYYHWIPAFAGMTEKGVGITGAIINLGFWFYVVSVLIVIFVYDLKHYIIPDKVLLPAIGLTAVYILFFNFSGLQGSLLAALAGFAFFFAIFFVSQGKWMGFGDVKLAILIGLLLGFPNTFAALFFAFFFGAIIGIISMIFGKKGLKSEIPFGPFLVLGTFAAEFWGEKLINWYLNFLL